MSTDRTLILQRTLFGTGALLLAVWAGAWVHGEWNRSRDVAAFDAALEAAADSVAVNSPGKGSATEIDRAVPEAMQTASETRPVRILPEPAQPDTSDWSAARIEHYQASLEQHDGLPEALLRIPTIDLEVPVITGTDELTLNRAVGRIPGTAHIRSAGNLGIAGHRDGFFRGLKDVGPGDLIELVTLEGRRSYEVSDIWIVDPSDVRVLAPTEATSLTLVTCYPFYFVGHAPQRYIVRAVLTGEAGATAAADPI